jgi:hypothetical protein
MKYTLLILYLVALIVIGFLLYLAIYKSIKVPERRPEIPRASFETHWWGYGWRPWWRKYRGVPGFNSEDDKPLPKPKIPVPPKPIIVNTNPILY